MSFMTYRRLAAVLVLGLSLAGCKITVTTLGEGTVSVVSNNATVCTGDATCYDGGYNRRVELQAVAAPGYTFTGWAGACEGTGPCDVRTLGNRHVIATFKASNVLEPLMNYVPDFFFSGPWPTDTRRNADGQLDLTDFPLNGGLFARAVKRAAKRSDGFARNGGILVPLATTWDMDLADMEWSSDSLPEDALQLIRLEPGSPDHGQSIPVTFRLHRSPELAEDSLLHVQPALGHSLEPGATYALLLFTLDPLEYLPFPVQQGAAMKRIIAHGADGKLGEHWSLVKSFVTENSAFAPEQVAAFTVFTTQGVSDKLPSVRTFVNQQDYATAARNIHFADADSIQSCNSYGDRNGYLLTLEMDLPNILTGRPPYLTSGGHLNRDAAGTLAANGSVRTRVGIALPCIPPAPGERLPVEIHALPTANGIQQYWNSDRFLYDPMVTTNHRVLRVFIPAPYTTDRQYSAGVQSLEWLSNLLNIDIDTAVVAAVLADFNPLNLGAVEPQYLQLGMEVLYLRHLLPHVLDQDFTTDPQQLGYWVGNTDWDFTNLTFAGTSLGALAALQANAIDPVPAKNLILTNMPRPNSIHVNNLVDFLSSQIGSETIHAIERLLGVRFPLSPASPLANLLQTGIDTIDPLNRLDALEDKNLLLGLAAFQDDLHGREPSYSIASALHLRYGLQHMRLDTELSGAHPISDYVSAVPLPVGSVATGSPLRVVMPHDYSVPALNGFTSQMAQGNRFDPLLP